MAEKPHLNLVVVGHIDHGKSTLVGRLLFETGSIGGHVIEAYRKEAQAKGKDSFEFAWVMDNLKEERERGITIDVAHRRFDTDKFYFTIIDAPGHRDFVKNMITGASQADAALLVVAANDGVMAQTKEHVFLSQTLGINQVIVIVNKMDIVDFKEDVFEKVKKETSELLSMIGYKPDEILFIPASAFQGENITKLSDKTPWYKGKTVLEALDTFVEPEKPTKLPLRLPIQDVYTISGVGTVPVGRVETGVLKKGEKIIFMPGRDGRGVEGEVKSIEMHHEEIPEAVPGDNIGFNVRGIDKNSVKRGDVCGHPAKPPTVAEEFDARIVVLSHPSAITAGYTPVFHTHTAQVACTIMEIKQKLDPKTGAVKEENPAFIKTGDAAVVTIKPSRPMVIEPYKDIPQMGRFAIRDMGTTIAAGMVVSVKTKK